ncbi:preprotein translocase subunit YajC [Eikenella halliae]|uniref:preprotein translocase subunit YajC n=1 Tax=Eikenella halliae TaxID=1795832 RepID=UPI0028D21E1A|nr:preprotein translocase subunit YajC [Eikenella halliae]
MLHFPLAAAAQPNLMSNAQSFLLPIFLLAMLYFMILRPRNRDEKRRREMISQLKKGDKVMTGAGMIGKVSKIGEEIIGLEVAPNTVVDFHRDAIIKKLEN